MLKFVNSQIICLDSQNKSLYCEVIDIVNDRQICWVRPVILVDLKAQDNNYFPQKNDVYDLRFTSDLLWKIDDFRIVLDTEYIEFLANLQEFEFDEDKLTIAKQKLRFFIQEILIVNKNNKKLIG
ncbi:hypothetical protein [Geminocystis sp. NIES-3709]|uniref:hypothetical protein n=1 Tax=Geminocystis sp. NIES-3709 TaxID=1617448 RepID=UPI0005FCC9AE|nr:hypothetical protein [Geminocystis sp. NIES-3709]BAQ64224.1 hypothetical protein GM3709_989 [Geminocystis sp. NIES-3709]